ncbi:MAG: response regulator [Bacteroidota bacterium]
MLFFLFHVACCLSSTAQQSRIDSLEQAVQASESSPKKVSLSLDLAKLMESEAPDQSLEWSRTALELARQLNDSIGQGNSLFQIGWIHFSQNRTRQAQKHFLESLPFLKANEDHTVLMQAYELITKMYQQQRRNKKALVYHRLWTHLKDSLLQIEAQQLHTEANEQMRQLDVMERKYDAGLKATAQVQQEKDSILQTLQLQEETALRKEAEIAQLEAEAALFEQEVAMNEMALREQLANRNMLLSLFGGIGLACLLLGFSFWQRSKLVKGKKRLAHEKQKADQLEKIDKIKDQFLANTSHELRTPLNGIIGIAESLYDGSEHFSPEKMRENLSMIISSGKRLSNLVNDILDYSQLNNTEIVLHPKAVDLHALISVVLHINRPLTQGKEIELINDIPKDLPPIHADENRLQQIMHNLIGNGIKFTQSGSVRISAAQKNKQIEILVQDTGIGIPLDKQDSIFQAFTQADGSISRQYSGTGLGLSISHNLVELHGGSIWVESEEGEGSSFHIRLPISTEQASSRVTIAPQALPSHPLLSPLTSSTSNGHPPANGQTYGSGRSQDQSLRILVIDDEPINQQVLKNHLSTENYTLVSAMDGLEALKAIQTEEKFDLVLLDIMMPGMSGYEVCQQIREQYLPSELPIIMITAKNQVSDLVEGLSYGANDYLAKPFSKAEFLARVKTHLQLFHINSASGRFVPQEFLRNLGHESILDVQLGDQVEREVTVQFSDIRSYTTLAESMSPRDTFRFLNAYLGRVGPIINQNNGFVSQFLGDGIMALFLDKPEDVVIASIEMQKQIAEYNRVRATKNRIPIRVGIGTHTGPLIMGVIGDDKRMDATVVADSVNTASRMEGLTKFYGASVIVSEATLAGITDPTRYLYRFLGKVQLKGRMSTIGVYDFFDGDPLEIIQKKQSSLELFEMGIRQYFEQDFESARQSFQEVLQIHPEDLAAQHYLRRSDSYLQQGVSNGWTGIELMQHK